MKLTIRILVVLFLFTYQFSSAQKLDSLNIVWKNKKLPDSVRVAAYNDYIWQGFLFSQPDSAYILAEKLINFKYNKATGKAKALGYNIQGLSFYVRSDYNNALTYFKKSFSIYEDQNNKKGMSSAINNIGLIYGNQGNYPKALDSYVKGLKLDEEIGDKKGMAISLGNIGIIYGNQGDYPKALEYFELGLEIHKEISNKKGMASMFNNIGLIYSKQNEYDSALNYYENSLTINKEIDDKKGVANSLNNIGIIYGDKEDYKKSLEFYKRGLKINEETGDKKGIADSFGNIGLNYSDQGNYTKALEYFEKSIKLTEEIGDNSGFARLLKNFGEVYIEQKRYFKAIKSCKQSLQLSTEIGSIESQKEASNCLYQSYKKLGYGSQALKYHELMVGLIDSLNTEETSKKLQKMEFEKTLFQDSIAKVEEARLIEIAHQEEIREEEQSRNIGFGIGGLVLILSVFLYNNLRIVRKSKNVLQVEKDRSEELLLNILPEEVATELKTTGKSEARDYKKISVLFTDFKGFTQQSAKLSAKDLVDEVNICFEAFDRITEKYNVEKIKTIGDAYMAAGGLPLPKKDSVKNTVLAAIEMQSFMTKRKQKMTAENKPAFEMRSGIHTGPIVAGIVGIKKFQYDIWGDTVNTASRMESHGEIGKVNISNETYLLLKDEPDFIFEKRDENIVKGKGKVQMYFVSKK